MRARGSLAGARRGRAGVTLVELLVTTGILLAVVALIALPLAIGFSYLERMLARTDAQRAASRATEAITRELAEAMYVFDIAPSGGQLSFMVPRARATPDSPGVVIRYWQALRDPTLAHKPYHQIAAAGTKRGEERFVEPPYNPYYLARSQIADPWWTRDDGWNPTNPDYPDEPWGLTRADFFYPNGYVYGGATWAESQPGYPWLAMVDAYAAGVQRRTRYRESAIAITPSDPNYDVPELAFAAARIGDETLTPGADFSLCRGRYPMWAGFADLTWTQADPPEWEWQAAGGEEHGSGVRVYRWDPVGGQYVLKYQTKVRAEDGSVWVCEADPADKDPGDAGTYNTRWYPLAKDPADVMTGRMMLRSAVDYPYAFGIDYDAGTIQFSFPALDGFEAEAGEFSYSLPTVSAAADGAVIEGSDRVTVGGELYHRVDGSPGVKQYYLSGTTVEFDSLNPPAEGTPITVAYRYRNNQDGDLVVATYATKKMITITLAVSKQDRAARQTRHARQDFRLVSRVEVRNTPD